MTLKDNTLNNILLIFTSQKSLRESCDISPAHYGNITRLSLLFRIHYFYNSKTRSDRQKQTAFLKTALKSSYVD